ncbi:M1 family aminopeptidase [Arthrobacter burdickii]|uniref:M1 family aminopeptidase n=1 Tax=Arthrobacter burdickii TaxID=3035920 RepID=A0ABT8K4D1_9MICC|nr:M1 family aminopeptidase [Arthrobacter burdickii]MDN4612303.1 M1 family aminopeptidase [Arthrobacter burdickii]
MPVSSATAAETTSESTQEEALSGGADYQPGAPGLGDPYFPLDGNGGYDVDQYVLDLSYDPLTDTLSGTATIIAKATQDLSAFNLDLEGLTVREVMVKGRPAQFTRDGGELTVTPQRGIRDGRRFTTEVRYDGVPETTTNPFGQSGFFHTDDGSLVIGEPHVAATWFPVNDHPLDKASYTFHITVPEGLEVVANGRLLDDRTRDGLTTWTWEAREPMASYLATASVGQWDFSQYKVGRIHYLDALDPDLFDPVAEPRTGTNFAWSQTAEGSYKRLTRTIKVPDSGAELSFWLTRDTEPDWDFAFVEARTVGAEDWTTLPDANGHTSGETGVVCPVWHGLHPFLTHYQTDDAAGGCTASGSSGAWWAASGASEGWEQWSVDLADFAGSEVEVSISYVSITQRPGVFVDDVVVSTGEGSTSFEDDGDTLDGWAVTGPPAGSPGNENDWVVTADPPPSAGENAQASLARQPEIIGFLEGYFGRYPFRDAGGTVDDLRGVGFALENQTRPIYSRDFFTDRVQGDSVVVHELAHQWIGDSVSVEAWQHIWLNEGFATYAEWLWSEREDLETVQEIFDSIASIPADNPFWSVRIGDPGPDALFDSAVYARGAMTLHALRQAVGDEDFFRILREWAQLHADGNVSTDDFITLAEKISGEELNPLFDEWLFTAEKPASLEVAAGAQSTAPGTNDVPPAIGNLERRLGDGKKR